VFLCKNIVISHVIPLKYSKINQDKKKTLPGNATPRPPVISPEATPDRLLVVVMARTATPGRRRCGRPWHQAWPRCASRGPPWACTDTGSPNAAQTPRPRQQRSRRPGRCMEDYTNFNQFLYNYNHNEIHDLLVPT
jgi:hypothetical protein